MRSISYTASPVKSESNGETKITHPRVLKDTGPSLARPAGVGFIVEAYGEKAREVAGCCGVSGI